MPKTQSNLAQHQKNNRLFRKNNRLFIPVHKYKLKLKSSRDREIAHTGLYWFTLNQELHPIFPETTGESTKQSSLDYLQYHQRSDLDPLKTHFLWFSANTTYNVDLDNLKSIQHFSSLHTKFLQSTKGLHLLHKDMKLIQDENPIPHSLDPSNLKAIFNFLKSKISEKLKFVFLWLNLSSCLLHKHNKLFITFKDWSKHLKLERN